MILLPGEMSRREDPRSELAFHWRAKDASLRALTGQLGSLTQIAPIALATVGGPITPAAGPALVAGKGQPRFVRDVDGAPALELSGSTAGQDQERLQFPFALHRHDLTLALKLRGLWTPGAAFAETWVASLGSSAADAGRIRVRRGGAGGAGPDWSVWRQTPLTTAASAGLPESVAIAWPAVVLVTYTKATEVTAIRVRGANGVEFGPVSSGTVAAAAGRFAGDTLTIGSDAEAGLGAPIRLHWAKIALGLYGLGEMELVQ